MYGGTGGGDNETVYVYCFAKNRIEKDFAKTIY